MKLYYTLTCVVLPAAMMTACSGSGSKKPMTAIDTASKEAIVKHVDLVAETKPIVPLTEKLASTTKTIIDTPENDLFPLTQTNEIHDDSKPVKRIYQFGFNKQEMNQSDRISLQEHADYLISHPDTALNINGHSDTQGHQAYNRFLSEERAKKIALFLVEYGVPADQIKVNGLGDSQPLNDVNNFQENRRVELQYSDSRVATK